jgi:hypothetical protein
MESYSGDLCWILICALGLIYAGAVGIIWEDLI